MADNRLGGETSPYLLQHADNPVHWRPWGPEALAEAHDSNKPILLSVGYAACHWCHVMAHESFENADLAQHMNALFVNIKVDREERPDIDTIYQTALAMLGQQGGWPLTMFLTPDGKPFWGGTYFPPEPRYGRPGFGQILQAVSRAYHNDKATITNNINALTDGLAQLSDGAPGQDIAPDQLTAVSDRLLSGIDRTHGGLGGAPKFPQPPVFSFLLGEGARRSEPKLIDAATHSVRQMAQGGLYDHLAGGFARYSVDAVWLVPHFEKMAYDNAGLIALMTDIHRLNGEPLFARRVEESVAWVLDELRVPGGGFASSYDADSEEEEGKFYVWSEAEIDDALGPDAQIFKSAYDVRPDGNWEGKTILNRSHVQRDDPAEEAVLAPLRAKLRTLRAKRVWPGCDDKVLADWNGLLIAALAEAAMAFDRSDWLDAAHQAYAFVRENLSTGETRLLHSWREGKAANTGILDDYANMANAAVTLFEASGDRSRLDEAMAWVEAVHSHFNDAEKGGYFLTADDADALIVRSKSALDNPAPAGNATMVRVLAKLAALTGRSDLLNRAETVIRAFSGNLDQHFWAVSSLLANAGFVSEPVQIVVIGEPDDPATKALLATATTTYLPNRILCPLSPGEGLPPGHPAEGKTMVESKPTAYYCPGQTCLAPVTDPADLANQLAR